MKNKDIEDDKLIGEFMGYKQFVYNVPYPEESVVQEVYYYEGELSTEDLECHAEDFPWDQMAFEETPLKEFNWNTNWNDLNKVLDKIKNMGNDVKIENNDCTIIPLEYAVFKFKPMMVGRVKLIDAVRTSILDYINLYNKECKKLD